MQPAGQLCKLWHQCQIVFIVGIIIIIIIIIIIMCLFLFFSFLIGNCMYVVYMC